MSVTSVSGYSLTSTESTQSSSGLDLGTETFLTILTAQLQYQDPMESMDNTEYISQLAEFSTLEQLDNLNDSMTSLINLQNIQLGTSLVGKEVSVAKDGITDTGVVEKITNLSGNLIFTVNGDEYDISEIMEISNE
jgi:flagellar basal-body rod modification protein FlgD